MEATGRSERRAPSPGDAHETILGYLNFSNGVPDAGAERAWNQWWETRPPAPGAGAPFRNTPSICEAEPGNQGTTRETRDQLLSSLRRLKETSKAFADCRQAEAVIRLVFDHVLPAYQAHHRDLLFHLTEADFRQPLFIARVCEAVLSQAGPWDETERIVQGALDQLNDFLGYRPLPVLENGRQMEPYPHERFRPVPLYIRGVGAAAGRYQRLIDRTIRFFQETPEAILHESHFDLSRMDELAMDVRAHDHLHPMNKRTNYMFGEWDPHQIDNKGFYRRFVVRQIILDLLLDWMQEHSGSIPDDELLYDASAALCGTMLMASSVSGSGPGTHDSTVTLNSLLPRIARQRDAFYERLLKNATGERARRLGRHAEMTQQPFGHVRQYLNMRLARHGARQVQNHHLSQLFARMGFPEESRRRAMMIPTASIRFESEIGWRITAGHLQLDRGQLREALRGLGEIEDLLERGIECGAIVDPWNILGFQELYPLFHSREDCIPDQRLETLLDLMERIFGLYSRCLGEAAARGEADLAESCSNAFRKLADRWDRYGSATVESLPNVSGHESWTSACRVSEALSEWRNAGEAAGDISFWREKVSRFQSARAYAMAAEALLEKGDDVAAMGLLMQWLSQAETVGLESGPHSIFPLLIRWLKVVADPEGGQCPPDRLWPRLRRLFDYLESNAEDYWHAPRLDDVAGSAPAGADEEPLEPLAEDENEEADLFGAAYDDVIYRDSADDGYVGETLDDDEAAQTEIAQIARYLEPRLKFLNTLAQMWQMAAAALSGNLKARKRGRSSATAQRKDDQQQRQEVILGWQRHLQSLEQDLLALMNSIWQYQIPVPADQLDSDGEYGVQLQEKIDLLQAVVATRVSCRNARQCLLCCVPDAALKRQEVPPAELLTIQFLRAILRRDVAETRRLFPRVVKHLSKQPLLYVPLENGGRPHKVYAARCRISLLQFLLAQLPRLGLLRETWWLLKTAYRMERNSRPAGTAVTEFDRLFRTSLRSTLESVIGAAQKRPDKFSDEDLVDFVGEIVEHYLDLWLKHSTTTRLSIAEKLEDDATWRDVTRFVKRYGGDLFHARLLLPPGRVRAILHHGIERFLGDLAEHQDPLHPIPLIEDIENGRIDRQHAANMLELIYESVIDGLERFLEYKTTTTQSDYGEMFYCLLDFLRVEAAYERDAWNLAPVGIAHELLAGPNHPEAAVIWEKLFAEKTGDKADRHLSELRTLEQRHGMQLPSISDRLSERFVRPLAVNRMVGLVGPAMKDAQNGRLPSQSFETLKAEIDDYLENICGSGLDVPPWMRNLEEAVDREDPYTGRRHTYLEATFKLPPVLMTLSQVRGELKHWNEPPGKKAAARKPTGRRPKHGRKNPPEGQNPA